MESLTFVLLVCHCPPYCPPYCCCAALTQHNFHCPTGLFSNHDVLHCVCTCCDVHFRIVLCVCVLCRALFCSYRSVLHCPLLSRCLHIHCLYHHVSLQIQFLASKVRYHDTHTATLDMSNPLSPCLTVPGHCVVSLAYAARHAHACLCLAYADFRILICVCTHTSAYCSVSAGSCYTTPLPQHTTPLPHHSTATALLPQHYSTPWRYGALNLNRALIEP